MDKLQIEKKVNEGLSTFDLAKHFSKSQTTIRYWLRKYGLNTKASKERAKKGVLNGRNCINCNKELTGCQSKFCCSTCKMQSHYKTQANTNERQKRVAKERKIKLIKMKGGCCENCGYNKNLAALQFHHRNPHEKTFGLDVRKLSNTRWDSILIEAEKCDLLCGNCHMEEHYPDMGNWK